MKPYLLAENFIKKAHKDGLVVLFHSGIAEQEGTLQNGIEGTFGAWLKDILKGATDDEDLAAKIENETKLAFFDEEPGWVSIKVANHLKTTLDKLTLNDILENGQLCIVGVDPEDYDFHRAGRIGDSFVEFSTYLNGEDTYESLPFGVEPGDIFSTAPYNPVDMTLTGSDLVTFLQRNFPKLNHLLEIESRSVLKTTDPKFDSDKTSEPSGSFNM